MKLRVIASCVQDGRGYLYVAATHALAEAKNPEEYFPLDSKKFILSDSRIVDRAESYNVAVSAGQIPPRTGFGSRSLNSDQISFTNEDLELAEHYALEHNELVAKQNELTTLGAPKNEASYYVNAEGVSNNYISRRFR